MNLTRLLPLLLGLLAVVLLIVDATPAADDVDVYLDMEAWIDDMETKVTK